MQKQIQWRNNCKTIIGVHEEREREQNKKFSSDCWQCQSCSDRFSIEEDLYLNTTVE